MNTKYLFNSIKLNHKEQGHLDSKVQKIEKFFQGYKNPDELIVAIDINQDKKSFWRIEIMIKTPHELFRVSKEDREFKVAVDMTINALLTQLRRHKDKMVSQNRRK